MRSRITSFSFVSVALAMALAYSSAAVSQTVVRGPYLQQATDSSVIVKWQTSSATDSVVRYGLIVDDLTQTQTVAGSTVDHEVLLTGLSQSTLYYYSIGNTAFTLAGGSSYNLQTSPIPGSISFTRMWIVGDSGTANSNAMAVRDAYKNEFTGPDRADMMIMLGDNAYSTGTEAEYQAAVFDMYPEILRQTPVWSAIGNHDGSTSVPPGESVPYYNIFTLPSLGESGGVPSGSEAYYSYDYANIHFVVLDSYQTNRSVGGAMLTWLTNDLAANTKEWLIAFWHHPPYTKGSHNSDTEGNLIDMRTNALPILDAYGVDLVLSGHSHSYERSFLIDGHYGNSDSFSAANLVDGGSGRPSGDGGYLKPDSVGAANAGAVYAVAGSSGKISGGTLDHEAMYISLNQLGSMVVEVDDKQLNAEFLNSAGQVTDWFTINKGVVIDSTPPVVLGANVVNSNLVEIEFNEPLDQATATTLTNYSVDSGISVLSASLSANGKIVTLGLSALDQDVSYTLSINNVTDLAGNAVAANSNLELIYHLVETRNYQDGVFPNSNYLGTSDSYMNSGQAGNSFGAATQLLLDGEDAGADLVSMIRWDISDIPAGSSINSVSISLGVFNPSNSSYQTYPLLRNWDEGLVSWNNADGSNWESGGAQGATDKGASSLGTINATGTGSYTLNLNATGVQVVQDWVDGTSSNFGLLFSNLTSSDGVDMYSRESSDPASRPKLSVTFENPAVVTNDPPTVSAGGDQSIRLPASVSLDGTISDDGLPNPPASVSSTWSLVSGPAAVSFTDANLEDTSASFSVDGVYLLRLLADDGSLSSSDDVEITVEPELTAPPAPSGLTAVLSGLNDVDLDWTDPPSTAENNETSYRVLRQDNGVAYLPIVTLAADSSTYTDSGLPNGTYSYQVEAINSIGSNVSNVTASLDILVPMPSTTYFASSESNTQGSIQSGSYLNTNSLVGAETLREQHQGGKPSRRISQLIHAWEITGVLEGSMVSIEINALAPANNEADDFVFEYSVNGGVYAEIGSIANGSGEQSLSATLPQGSSGTVHVRVSDTNRDTGNGGLDTLDVSYIAVTSVGNAGDLAPVVIIGQPADSQNFNAGDLVFFSASAIDDNEGDLSGSIEWLSDLQGALGIGADISRDDLIVGTHVITAQAQDMVPNTGTDSVTIIISPLPGDNPPTVSINSPSDGSVIEQGETVAFSGTATDVEDGDLSASLSWSSDLDGSIGSGAGFSTSALTIGSHTIAASATDSALNTVADSITISITAPAGSINLTILANKLKGKHTPLLSWTGAVSSDVDIYRDNAVAVTTGNDGSYQDATGNKGGRTYIYKVCEAGTQICSADVSVNY